VSIFVDTSALYALIVRTESGHDLMTKAFQKLVERGQPLLTTNYVLVETTALLQHRFGLTAVHDLETLLGPLIEIRWISAEVHRRAVDRLTRIDRRHLSLVDCVSFVVMDTEGIREVLGLDGHFRDEGYRLIPAPEG
jgi:predicted nucleic acid-binding protein